MNVLRPQALVHDRYRILNLMGQGGFGAVYAAIDERLERRVALKQLLRVNERISRQFTREAQLLAHLVHPGMPRVTDHFSDDDGQFLVMDYVPGDDLAALLLERDAPFPVEQVLAWGFQLLDVLHYLHTRQPQIIHRDIKPQNLKLQDDGRIVLLDFGLAKGHAGDVRPATSEGSLLAYTKGYAPPEQIEGSGTDERSDLYALGATLYCLLTNAAPVEAQMRLLAAARGKLDPLPAPHQLNPAVPEAVSEVLMQTLALDPAARPASAAAMRQILAAAQTSAGITVEARPPFAEAYAPSEATIVDGMTQPGTSYRSMAPTQSPPDHAPVADSEELPGATHFWWIRVPLAAQRVSRTLARALADGHYIAAYLRRSLVAAPLTVFVGLLVGWLHPDFEFVAIEALVLISVLAALSTLSGHLGAMFLAGFAVGDFVLASHDRFYVRGLMSNLLYVRVPLLIEYVLFGVLLVAIPLLAKAMTEQLLPARRGGRQIPLLLAVVGHAAFTFGLVYLWTQGMPLLIQPVFTWPGSYVRAETIDPLLAHGYLVAGAALIASATRTMLQYRTTKQPQLTGRVDHVERELAAQGSSAVSRRWPTALLVVGRTLWSWLLLAGLLQSWFAMLLAIPVLFVLQATRAGLVPAWTRLVSRIPFAARVVGGGALLVLLVRLLAADAELGSYYTPPIGLLLGTAFMAALIVFGMDVMVGIVRGAAQTLLGREPRDTTEQSWCRRVLGIGPLDIDGPASSRVAASAPPIPAKAAAQPPTDRPLRLPSIEPRAADATELASE